MNRYRTILPGLLIILTLAATIAQATIITVKQDGTGDYTTIQEGVDASANSDTVLVWPEIYVENAACTNKNIVLASLYLTTQDDWYRYNTIINGHMIGACVKISEGTEPVTVCGFTIMNGSGWQNKRGGGGYFFRPWRKLF